MILNYTMMGKRIKEARNRKGMTQAELAEVVDKSVSYISYIETGRKRLSIETLVDIANALSVTADYILYLDLEFIRNGGVKSEIDAVLDGCSTKERKIILETAVSLKKILKSSFKYDCR